MTSGKSKSRPPASLFALGHRELPQTFSAEGVTYEFVELFKHDFFAATGLYRVISMNGASVRVQEILTNGLGKGFAVLKVQRTQSFYGWPTFGIGWYVGGREMRIYKKLEGIRGIPAFLGKVGLTGFVHAFIPGHDLHKHTVLGPRFFPELEILLANIHQRQVAYVDTNKRENILVGDDGLPWLIDFQISADRRWWNPFSRWIVSRFIKADWYHFYKHKTKLAPKECTPADFEKARRRGVLHEIHRKFTWPLIRMRRWWLAKYDLAKTR